MAAGAAASTMTGAAEVLAAPLEDPWGVAALAPVDLGGRADLGAWVDRGDLEDQVSDDDDNCLTYFLYLFFYCLIISFIIYYFLRFLLFLGHFFLLFHYLLFSFVFSLFFLYSDIFFLIFIIFY